MGTRTCSEEILDSAFEEIAQTLGGFIAVDATRPPMAWKLVGEVCSTWFRARSRISRDEADLPTELHPSVRSFIAALRSER